MAEIERPAGGVSDGQGGRFGLTLIVEDTQTTIDPRGRVSPTVVAVQLSNSTTQDGVMRWQSSSGDFVIDPVLQGESREVRISPPNRMFLHEWLVGSWMSWG